MPVRERPAGVLAEEFGVGGGGEGDELVVGEVDVEIVGFGEPHHVDDAAKGFGRVGIASHIDEEGAVGEVGLVLDFDAWELPFSGGGGGGGGGGGW